MGIEMLLWRRRAEALSRQCGLRIPGIALGETVPLLGVHLGEGALPFQGQKSWGGLSLNCSIHKHRNRDTC